jgi:TRAP-type C4-dicarboxylate transport system substrate-binding protein
MLLMSSRVWKKLDPQVQAWVQQAADESVVFQRKLWAEKTLESLELAKAEGVTIYEVDTAAFAAKVAPMLAEIENPEVRELLKQISEVK